MTDLPPDKVLARLIYEASDDYAEHGIEWERQYGRVKREALAQAAAVAPLIAGWLAEARAGAWRGAPATRPRPVRWDAYTRPEADR